MLEFSAEHQWKKSHCWYQERHLFNEVPLWLEKHFSNWQGSCKIRSKMYDAPEKNSVYVCTQALVEYVCAPSMYKIPLKAPRISPLGAAVLQLHTTCTDCNLTSCDTSTSLKVRTSTPAPCGQWESLRVPLANWQNVCRVVLFLSWTIFVGSCRAGCVFVQCAGTACCRDTVLLNLSTSSSALNGNHKHKYWLNFYIYCRYCLKADTPPLSTSLCWKITDKNNKKGRECG